MTTTIENCTISQKPYAGEKRIGRPTFHHVGGGVYEILARCQNTEGGQCFRSYGLFKLEDVPQWMWNAK
jgi:hypothetical protein